MDHEEGTKWIHGPNKLCGLFFKHLNSVALYKLLHEFLLLRASMVIRPQKLEIIWRKPRGLYGSYHIYCTVICNCKWATVNQFFMGTVIDLLALGIRAYSINHLLISSLPYVVLYFQLVLFIGVVILNFVINVLRTCFMCSTTSNMDQTITFWDQFHWTHTTSTMHSPALQIF